MECVKTVKTIDLSKNFTIPLNNTFSALCLTLHFFCFYSLGWVQVQSLGWVQAVIGSSINCGIIISGPYVTFRNN